MLAALINLENNLVVNVIEIEEITQDFKNSLGLEFPNHDVIKIEDHHVIPTSYGNSYWNGEGFTFSNTYVFPTPTAPNTGEIWNWDPILEIWNKQE